MTGPKSGPLNRRRLAAKAALYAAFALFAAVLQTNPGYGVRILGITPDILLCAVMAAAVFEGERFAAVFAFVSGFLYDAAFAMPYMLTGLTLFFCAYVGAYIARIYLGRKLLTMMTLTAGCALVRGLVNLFVALGIWNGFEFGYLFSRVLLPEFLLTLVFAPAAYFLVKFTAARIDASY